MRKFIGGFLIGFILACGALAAAAPASIAAFQTGFQLLIHGRAVKADRAVLTINGSYYVPAKPVSEALGIKYNVNLKKRALEFGTAPALPPSGKYTLFNPAPLNVLQALAYQDLDAQLKADIQVKEVVRGAAAWQMVQPANPFNTPPRSGYEYLLARIYFKLTDIPDGKACGLRPADFSLVSEKGREYLDKTYVVPPDPELRANLYKGADHEGWVIYELRTDDLKPRIAFGRMRDGTGGVWFRAYSD